MEIIWIGKWNNLGKPAGVPFLLERDITRDYQRFRDSGNSAAFLEWVRTFMQGQVKAWVDGSSFRFLPKLDLADCLFRIESDTGPLYLSYEQDMWDELIRVGVTVVTGAGASRYNHGLEMEQDSG